MKKIVTSCALMALSTPVFAVTVVPVPEPGVLGLFGIGIVALLLARRKNK